MPRRSERSRIAGSGMLEWGEDSSLHEMVDRDDDEGTVSVHNFVFFLWCLLGLPLFVALETSLLAGLEHRENAWKHIFALPIGRWSIYAAKLLVAAALVALSTLVLAVGVGIEGFVLLTLRPDLGLTLPIPWATIFGQALVFAVAAVLLLSVQAWVATRWRSFTVALGLGIVSTVAGLVLSISTPRSAGLASLFP